ncbi:MAG: hypothetical protein DMF62_17235, partial [Acidobacteria bacterium]
KEAEGEAYYISETGKAEAEKMRLMGEAQGVAYREQVSALGGANIAIIETLKVIGEKNVRITPDILASGGGTGEGGGIGTLLLLNLFKEQMKNNGSELTNGTNKTERGHSCPHEPEWRIMLGFQLPCSNALRS